MLINRYTNSCWAHAFWQKIDIQNNELENIIMHSSIKKKQNFDLKRNGINVPRYNFYKYFQDSLM